MSQANHWTRRVIAPDDHLPPLPICEMCGFFSAVFHVSERIESLYLTHDLCVDCFRHRVLLWERYPVVVQVERWQDRNEAG